PGLVRVFDPALRAVQPAGGWPHLAQDSGGRLHLRKRQDLRLHQPQRPKLEVYNRYYQLFRQQLPAPDLVIYLQASPEVLKKRLRKKNLPGETAVSDDYIEEVVRAYEHFFFHYTSSDLLVVNTNEIDFVERHTDLQELLRRVSEPIRGTQYFLPLGSTGAVGA